jgi:hypothetical protein
LAVIAARDDVIKTNPDSGLNLFLMMFAFSSVSSPSTYTPFTHSSITFQPRISNRPRIAV